jgi:5-methylcytosine-specific restriction endonuclease McrA
LRSKQALRNSARRAIRRRICKWVNKNRLIRNPHLLKNRMLFEIFLKENELEVPVEFSGPEKYIIHLYTVGGHEIFRDNRETFYLSKRWRSVRARILKLFGNKCMKCGSENHISVDHILPRSKYPHLELDVTNLQVLCRSCNSQKGNRSRKDYRP